MKFCPVANFFFFVVIFKGNSKSGNSKLAVTFKFLLKDLYNKIDRLAVKRKQIEAPLKLKTFRDWHIVQLPVSLLTVHNGCALILNTFQYGFMYGNWRSGNHGLIRNVTRKLAILLFYKKLIRMWPFAVVVLFLHVDVVVLVCRAQNYEGKMCRSLVKRWARTKCIDVTVWFIAQRCILALFYII